MSRILQFIYIIILFSSCYQISNSKIVRFESTSDSRYKKRIFNETNGIDENSNFFGDIILSGNPKVLLNFSSYRNEENKLIITLPSTWVLQKKESLLYSTIGSGKLNNTEFFIILKQDKLSSDATLKGYVEYVKQVLLNDSLEVAENVSVVKKKTAKNKEVYYLSSILKTGKNRFRTLSYFIEDESFFYEISIKYEEKEKNDDIQIKLFDLVVQSIMLNGVAPLRSIKEKSF